MPVFFRWRIQHGLVAAIIAGVACAFCIMEFSRGGVETSLSLTTVLGLSQVMGVAVASGYAALCGSFFLRPLRQRRGLRRHPLRISFGVFWPVIIVLTTGYIPAYVGLLATGSESFLPRLDVLFPTWFMCIAICSIGLALGAWLPAVVSAPTSALGAFYVMAFPWSFSNPLLKNMTILEDCCTLDTQPNIRVLIAVTVTALGIITLAGAILTALLTPASTSRRSSSHMVLAAGLTIAVITWSSSALLVRNIDYSQTVLRAGDQLCSIEGNHEFCYWPEEAREWDKDGHLISATLEHLHQSTGLDISPVLTTSQKRASDDRDSSAFAFRWNDDSSSSEREELSFEDFRTFTYGLITPVDIDCSEENPHAIRLDDASEMALAWLADHAGITNWANDLMLSSTPESAQTVMLEVRSLSKRDQLDWFILTNKAVEQCQPDLLPEPTLPGPNA